MGPVAYVNLCLLGCLIFNPSLTGAQAASCPSGWLSFQDDCYGYFPQELSWAQAEAQCQSFGRGAHLASIHSEEEHSAVAAFVTRAQRHDDEDVWIGLHIPARSQDWAWTDGSATDYSTWDDNRSYFSPKGDNCALLEEDSGFLTWDNDSCNDRNPFVCKYRP
ncbi:dromaiocalcin-1-like [Emydura macquarii macquarii]|uniref:dromaiocalcin-1-like n=1 Tax=Emydura macquarii macquarii TaxID=1129001 RepID=UPI00352B6945